MKFRKNFLGKLSMVHGLFILFILALIFLFHTFYGQSVQMKVLYIMSYHSPWEWTDTQFEGFKEGLKTLNIQYRVYQMDTKRNNSETWKQNAGKEARALIDSWKPDLVYVSDDDAMNYVVKYYVNADLPFVFSAVNADPASGQFIKGKNITGVLEREHFVESVRLLLEIAPNVRRIAVMTDPDTMWQPVIKRMKAKLYQIPEVKFITWDAAKTFAEYQEKMKGYKTRADAVALLGIFSFKDESGLNVPYQEVLKWTAENSVLPDFSFWKDRVSFGTLCVVSVSGYQQGLAAGKIAYGILAEGKKPADFEILPTDKGEPLVNLARAKKLKLNIKSKVLLSSQVIQSFEWEK